MKAFIFILLILLLGCINHDNPQPYPPATPASCVRIGAVCNDNTTTSSTGTDACSGHGGVSSWICQ